MVKTNGRAARKLALLLTAVMEKDTRFAVSYLNVFVHIAMATAEGGTISLTDLERLTHLSRSQVQRATDTLGDLRFKQSVTAPSVEGLGLVMKDHTATSARDKE